MSVYPRPPRRVAWTLDIVFVVWIAIWFALGLQVFREVRGLSGLSDTVIIAAGALRETANLVGTLESVPFVGGEVGDLADRVRATARSANRQAVASKDSVRDLSVLLGLSIALIPSIPLAAVYLPLRLAWRREGQEVRRGLARGDPDVDRFLALRAVQHLSYDQLLEASNDPWGDLAAGRHDRLANAELERLGIRRPLPRR